MSVNIFLDSGAFSAFSQGVEIDLDDYIQFIKDHDHLIEVYANLDVIGDPVATWKNQRIMERAGLNPLPCFHFGEDWKWLTKYIDRGHEYIALGGVAQLGTVKKLRAWFDVCFSDYLCGPDGMPRVKVHGYGMTSFPLLWRSPWWSVDSTSWVLTGRMGSIHVPAHRGGAPNYRTTPWKISVSGRSPNRKDAGRHFDTFSDMEKSQILEYIHGKGFEIGVSSFRIETEGYELEENEIWSGKAKDGEREVEVLEKRGVSNCYKVRDQMNIAYYLDLEGTFPEWPWPFKLVRGGLDL